jgi:methyl-accepting chemotaxis protein
MAYEKQSDRIEALEKGAREMQGAIRRLAEQASSNLKLISEMRDGLENIRQELARVKNAAEKAGGLYDNSVQRYE